MSRFDSVLVANRGEIAVRVIRSARAAGYRTIAVYSDADAEAPHVAAADEAVRIGPAPVKESYLDGERILAAARRSGAGAIDNRTKAPDGAVPFRCRQRQVTHVVELAIENLCPLLAIQNIGGGRAVNGYRTGTATGNSDRIDRLLHTALEADIGKAINQAAASDHCAAISGNAVDRRSKTHRSGTASGNRTGQRSDGQALTCAGIQ